MLASRGRKNLSDSSCDLSPPIKLETSSELDPRGVAFRRSEEPEDLLDCLALMFRAYEERYHNATCAV
jgi:hypothetical protein